MPSQILHSLFAEDLYGEIISSGALGEEAGEFLNLILRKFRKAFVLGTQGPDIFYHSQGRRPLGFAYGSLLHRRGIGNFCAGLLGAALPAGEIRALGAYALGFITHPILDRLAHPFIIYKSLYCSGSLSKAPAISRPRSFHAFFERIIDSLMLKNLRNTHVSGWDQEEFLGESCENPPPGLKELLCQTLVSAFPERAGEDEKLKSRIDNTFLDCAGFYRKTAPANTSMEKPGEKPGFINAGEMTKRRLSLLYPEKLPPDIDFLNLEKRPWYYPGGEKKEDQRSFPEIYTQAVRAAVSTLGPLVKGLLEEGFLPCKEAAGLIGNGGLSITDEAGNPLLPVYSDPLPLEEVLEGQARFRGAVNLQPGSLR